MRRLIFLWAATLGLFGFSAKSIGQTAPNSTIQKYNLAHLTQSSMASNSISHAEINLAKGDVWFGTNKGFSVTNNGGNSFRNMPGADRIIKQGVYSLVVKHDTILASTAKRISTGNETVPAGDGFILSTDNGASWLEFAQPLDSENDTLVEYGQNKLKALPIIVPEQNVIYDFAIGPNAGMFWAATWSGGIRRSNDFGQTWERVVLPPTGARTISPEQTLDFEIEPARGSSGHMVYLGFSVLLASDGALWVGTVDGLCKSTNPAATDPSWVKYNRGFSQISGNWITVIKEQPTNGAIWAASWQAEGSDEFDGVSYTLDNGQTWQVTLAGERIYDISFSGETVYAAGVNGLFISHDGGASWSHKVSLTDKTNPRKQILASSEFYCCETEKVYSNLTRVWVGTEDGLCVSSDEGMNWTVFRTAAPTSESKKTYAYPNPFSSKLDRVVRLRYQMQKPGSVSIKIFDFAMSPVRTLLENQYRSQTPEEEDTWDGKNDFGARVANGVYFYRVEQKDEEPYWGKILVLE